MGLEIKWDLDKKSIKKLSLKVRSFLCIQSLIIGWNLCPVHEPFFLGRVMQFGVFPHDALEFSTYMTNV